MCRDGSILYRVNSAEAVAAIVVISVEHITQIYVHSVPHDEQGHSEVAVGRKSERVYGPLKVQTSNNKMHQWFSGKIRRCHRRAPCSIHG